MKQKPSASFATQTQSHVVVGSTKSSLATSKLAKDLPPFGSPEDGVSRGAANNDRSGGSSILSGSELKDLDDGAFKDLG